MLDERDGSFGSRWLLITRGLRNVAPLAERTRRIPSRAERARSRSDTLQVSPRDQSSHHWHCFIDLACAGGGGLRRLRSALPHTRGSFTAQSPPLNHLHLIIFSILAFGPPPAKKKLLINSNGGPYRAPQNSQTAGRIWEWLQLRGPHLLGSKHSQLPPTQLT